VSTDPTVSNLLDQLCTNAGRRKVRSLRLIHRICCEQKERGSLDYTVSTIGRLSSAEDGPCARSIRNKTGAAYQALIACHATQAKAGTGRPPIAADDLLEGLRDPVLKARVSFLQAELAATRAQLLAARQLANRHAELTLIPAQGGSEMPVAKMGAALPVDLTSTERTALCGALSSQQLDHWGWTIDDRGRVLSDSGRTIFPIGFASALKKIGEAFGDA
jgi:hypothetical protein